MSKFTLKIVTPTYTKISAVDGVEVFEHQSPPFIDIYASGKAVDDRLYLDFDCTVYIENLNGKTVHVVRGGVMEPSR